MNETELLKKRIEALETVITALIPNEQYIFQQGIQIMDGRHIKLGRTDGTKIGTDSTQKLSFYGETPVVQASAIGQASGGTTVDAEARTALNSLLTACKNIGIIG